MTRCPLPKYPFQRVQAWQRYAGPVPGLPGSATVATAPSPPPSSPRAPVPDQPLVYQRAQWAGAPAPAAAERFEPGRTLLLGTDASIRDAVAQRLRADRVPVATLDHRPNAEPGRLGPDRWAADLDNWSELSTVLAHYADQGDPVRTVISCSSLGSQAPLDDLVTGCHIPFAAAAAGLRAAAGRALTVLVCRASADAAAADPTGRAAAAALRTLAAEHPRLSGAVLGYPAGLAPSAAADRVLDELATATTGVAEVQLGPDGRQVRELVRFVRSRRSIAVVSRYVRTAAT